MCKMKPNVASVNEATIPLNDNFVQPNGTRVRDLRQERGWTQEELAGRAGYSKRTIENIEAGKRTRPKTLAEVAQVLRVEPGQITAPDSEEAAGGGPAAVPDAGPREAAPRSVLTYENGPHPLPPPLARSQLAEAAPPLPAAASPPKCSVLVVDDEPEVLSSLAKLLSPEFDVFIAESAEAAQVSFGYRPIDIILTDQRMPRQTGVELLEWVRQHHPRTTRLLMTGSVEFNDAVDAINRGRVYHFIAKPWLGDVLLEVLRHAAEKFQLERSRDHLLEELRRSNRELEDANRRLLQRTRELEQAALTDALTGLFNRRAIEELARFELKRHLRYRRPLSIGLIEVDQADLLTSEQLRSGSDDVLEELAGILASSLRELDSVGRVHGAKFLAVARETGAEGAARLALRLRAMVASTQFECLGRVLPITISIGFAVADVGVHADFTAMADLAAAALAHARTAGCNGCEVRRLPTPSPEDV
jgi:diguanylate cyclase (GGDEF)-like protein